jgi:hypothetical protein
MAHDIHTKAKAMADLLLGEAPSQIAAALDVPDRTVRRWRIEAFDLLGDVPELAKIGKIWSSQADPMHSGQKCCAKTRSGGLCQNLPVAGARRCRMHGGRSK